MTKRYLFILLFCFSHTSLFAQINRPIGTNLSGIEDWSTEYVFVDVFNQSRDWIAHEYGWNVPWSSGVEIPLFTDGYPIEIPYSNFVDPPQAIRSLMFFGDLEGRYPGGMYRLMAKGSGQIRLWGAAQGTFKCPVDTLVHVDPALGGVALEIDTSSRMNHVRDIHFVMPGFHQTFEQNPFHPDFLRFLEDFQVIRFMDWMKTNNSPVSGWYDRNYFFRQTNSNGVLQEHLIDLCNRLQKDAWICIPHQADDNFVMRFARLLKNTLDPNLKIYIEYSNEVWNGIFDQHHYAADTALALGYTGQPWERAWKYTAKRSADIFVIFEQEFVDDSRLVKVVPGWAGNSWTTNYILDRFEETTYNPTGVQADAVAIAPYFAGSVANRIGDNGQINSISIAAILDSMELALEDAYAFMDDNKAVADNHGVELIAYEGGQHLVATWPHIEDTTLTKKLIAANHHPRMEDLYCQYFDHWYDSTGGGVFASFSSHSLYGKYGSWGVKEFMEDTLSPKYMGLKNCVFSYNRDTVNTPIDLFAESILKVYPVPAHDGVFYVEHSLISPTIQLFELTGKEIPIEIISVDQGKTRIWAKEFRGVGTLLIRKGDLVWVKKVVVSE